MRKIKNRETPHVLLQNHPASIKRKRDGDAFGNFEHVIHAIKATGKTGALHKVGISRVIIMA